MSLPLPSPAGSPEWLVQHLGRDSLAAFEEFAATWRARAAALRDHAAELRADAAALEWRSEAAEGFQRRLAARTGELEDLAAEADGVALAVDRHAEEVRAAAQGIAHAAAQALEQGREGAARLIDLLGETIEAGGEGLELIGELLRTGVLPPGLPTPPFPGAG
jgi:methyl-accepting chemotaxis protein